MWQATLKTWKTKGFQPNDQWLYQFLKDRLTDEPVGHASLELTFPKTKATQELVDKYCVKNHIPYTIKRIREINAKGQINYLDHYVVYFSWWPGELKNSPLEDQFEERRDRTTHYHKDWDKSNVDKEKIKPSLMDLIPADLVNFLSKDSDTQDKIYNFFGKIDALLDLKEKEKFLGIEQITHVRDLQDDTTLRKIAALFSIKGERLLSDEMTPESMYLYVLLMKFIPQEIKDIADLQNNGIFEQFKDWESFFKNEIIIQNYEEKFSLEEITHARINNAELLLKFINHVLNIDPSDQLIVFPPEINVSNILFDIFTVLSSKLQNRDKQQLLIQLIHKYNEINILERTYNTKDKPTNVEQQIRSKSKDYQNLINKAQPNSNFKEEYKSNHKIVMRYVANCEQPTNIEEFLENIKKLAKFEQMNLEDTLIQIQQIIRSENDLLYENEPTLSSVYLFVLLSKIISKDKQHTLGINNNTVLNRFVNLEQLLADEYHVLKYKDILTRDQIDNIKQKSTKILTSFIEEELKRQNPNLIPNIESCTDVSTILFDVIQILSSDINAEDKLSQINKIILLRNKIINTEIKLLQHQTKLIDKAMMKSPKDVLLLRKELKELNSAYAKEMLNLNSNFSVVFGKSNQLLKDYFIDNYSSYGLHPDVETTLPLEMKVTDTQNLALDLEEMLKKMSAITQASEGEGYDLIERNCSTTIGAVLEAGAKNYKHKATFSKNDPFITPQSLQNQVYAFKHNIERQKSSQHGQQGKQHHPVKKKATLFKKIGKENSQYSVISESNPRNALLIMKQALVNKPDKIPVLNDQSQKRLTQFLAKLKRNDPLVQEYESLLKEISIRANALSLKQDKAFLKPKH